MKSTKVKESKSAIGKKSRLKGKVFEMAVRKDLEEKGWIVTKFVNQVNFEKDKLVPAKGKFNPFLKRVLSEGSGFPDFLCYKQSEKEDLFEIIGVESKFGRYLDAKEKNISKWLIDHKIFNKILIAYKDKQKNMRRISYYEFVC